MRTREARMPPTAPHVLWLTLLVLFPPPCPGAGRPAEALELMVASLPVLAAMLERQVGGVQGQQAGLCSRPASSVGRQAGAVTSTRALQMHVFGT